MFRLDTNLSLTHRVIFGLPLAAFSKWKSYNIMLALGQNQHC